MKFKKSLTLILCTFIWSCASPNKVELQSSDPREAVEEIQDLKQSLIDSNVDVLAKKSFQKGNKNLNQAIKKFNDKQSKEEVMSQLAQAKAHYFDAKETSSTRTVIPQSIMDARSRAMDAKLLNSKKLKGELDDLDDSLIDRTDRFSSKLSVDRLSKFQSEYLKLEVEAIKNSQLGLFRKTLRDAENNDAEDLAPNTYIEASSNGEIAENLINQSPRNSSEYSASVNEANRSVKLLKDVMSKLMGDAEGASEDVALKLVFQERRLDQFSDKVDNLEGSLQSNNTKIGDMSKELEANRGQMLDDGNRIRFQKAMASVGQRFSEDEAAVYQQGDNLIIRLKKINFKSGSANIPTNSMSLLSKIDEIVRELNPKEVVIEGHTDSTGQQKNNMELSDNRAKAVREYFVSLNPEYTVGAHGFGESRPIANNQTQSGRSMNRRVDIVIKAE